MTSYGPKAIRVIGNYIKPNCTLETMKKIHSDFTGESKKFSRWERGQEEYGQQEWDDTSFEEFLRITKEAVEGDIEEISEAYLDILEPEEITTDLITGSLDSNLVVSDDSSRREGFQYRIDKKGHVRASYYYYTSDVTITEDLEIEDLPNQKRIPMTFVPERRLVIIRTTQPALVGKAKKTIDELTVLDVDTTGNLNLVEDDAEEIVRSFIDSFKTERDYDE
ncbi:hypothetical protein [Haloferax sp. ATCC BAA-644]|uniref:hypothetical protein n=1 Tax=Haloferax sp. ATCC BAA-644 TaxID=1227462 RepID=UPI001266FAFA|nr:hypothetical protein [Haloferax sp. ATCC BAA-644]